MSEEIVERLPDTLNDWAGIHLEIFNDETPELDVEGARMSGKSTLLLDKEIHYLRIYPGIKTLICRYSETACATKVRPRAEEIFAIRKFIPDRWDAKELCYVFANGSKMYAFGLKAANSAARYEKLRGLDVARVYVDQAEELPGDIGQELRASLRQKGYPHQITFSPNPVPRNHPLADKKHGGFPEDNSIPGRRHYQVSIFDNRANLPPESIDMMLRTYPPDHAKHGPMILGARGPNVFGDAVFGDETFRRALHVRPIATNVDGELYEAFHVGKHNPTVVYAQRPYAGGLVLLGGILGEDLFLEDFVPIVKQHLAMWFRNHQGKILTCASPDGASVATSGSRFTSQQVLRSAGYTVRSIEGSNAADIQLGLIEQIAGYQRRRNITGDESFGVNNDPARWLTASGEGVEQNPFMAHAFEATLVWDEHMASVGNNVVRKIHEDDYYANAVHCVQAIEINFCGSRQTQADAEKQRQAQREQTYTGPTSWMSI